MRERIKKVYFKYSWFSSIVNLFIAIRTMILPESFRLKLRFKRTVGYSLNLDNPITLNEKIQWLKLNDRSPLHSICADKYAVRNFIKEKIGATYLIPLVFKSYNPKEIKEEKFPDFPFIIKTNHDSSGGIIIKDKKNANWAEIRNTMKRRMSTNYSIFGKGEWQYASIEPMLIAEKLLLTKDGRIPADFKMHCFNGKLQFTQVDINRQINYSKNLYDREWNFIPVEWNRQNGPHVDKPKVYTRMIELAEILAKDFIYVRVDFYVLETAIFFGELTFHPGSGDLPFRPQKWDTIFGNMLKLPIK